MKNPRSKSPTTASSHGLHKNPIFSVLVGLTTMLVALSLFMYTKLEGIERDDDVVLPAGFDLRSSLRHKDKKHKHKKNHRGDKMKGGGGLEDQIVDFEAFKKDEAKRRAKHGTFTLREEFERDHPYGSLADLKEKVQKLRQPDLPTQQQMPYDIHNCPLEPPPNYPFAWNVRQVLEAWNPDNTDLPSSIHQGLCVFDWDNDREKAFNYRDKEVPFVLQNSPEILKASVRWTSSNNNNPYLQQLLGDEPIRNEHSLNNHFMYWKTRHPLHSDFTPPTDMTELTFEEWYKRAVELDPVSAQDQVSKEHWYFRLNAMLQNHASVYEELPFFDPTLGEAMTMIDPTQHRGINCRFGMKGVTAETHFDSSSNFIVLMGGQRRYILAHPNQCSEMELYPADHPSGRHTSIEWSEFDFAKDRSNRPFTRAKVNEVVLQAGDLMYLPTYWFHFIVSLNLNYQCNSRSGASSFYEDSIADCGFAPATKGMKKPKRKGRE